MAHPVGVVGKGRIAVSARIRPLPGVRPHVVNHLGLHPERLLAHLANKGQLALVGQHVSLQGRLLLERLPAQIAHKVPLFSMPSEVLLELRFRVKLLRTDVARKVPLVPVDPLVQFQIRREGKLFPADCALVPFWSIFPNAVLFEANLRVEATEADLALVRSIDVAESEVGLDFVVLVVSLTVLEKGFVGGKGLFAIFGATENAEFFLELFRNDWDLFVVVGVGFSSHWLSTPELAGFALEDSVQFVDVGLMTFYGSYS